MEAPVSRRNGPKNGEWITRRADGSIKTRVNYKDGLKDGYSYLYYGDGKTIQLEVPYVNSKKHGVSRKYFENGRVYSETPYQEDNMHGTRKTYYRSGQLKSAIDYSVGQPSIGLLEYYQSGNLKSQPEIVYTHKGNSIVLSVDTDDCKRVSFFLGKLDQDRYLPAYADLEPIGGSYGQFMIDLSVFTPSYLAIQDVICECTTSQGNPLILKKRIQF
jgi:hypothetical protein